MQLFVQSSKCVLKTYRCRKAGVEVAGVPFIFNKGTELMVRNLIQGLILVANYQYRHCFSLRGHKDMQVSKQNIKQTTK